MKLMKIEPQNGDGSKCLRIRPHHLLCIQGFQGYGYSKEFKENLARIIEEIKAFPEIDIKIVTGVDYICESCPYNFKNGCKVEFEAENRIMNMDKLTMEKLDLNDGSVYSASDVFSRTSNLNLEDVNGICRSCSWKTKCGWFLSL